VPLFIAGVFDLTVMPQHPGFRSTLPLACRSLDPVSQFKIEPFKHPLKLDPNYAGETHRTAGLPHQPPTSPLEHPSMIMHSLFYQ
jgi:hypothetical protein